MSTNTSQHTDSETHIPTPETPFCNEALQLARSSLPMPIFNHSIRTYLLAKHLAELAASRYSTTHIQYLFVACVLHDIGCAPQFDGPQRFEVEAADAAAELLRRHQVDEAEVHEVWVSIAIHTSPGIAERISDLARLVQKAVKIEFGKVIDPGLNEHRDKIERQFPRHGIEKCLGDVVVEQAIRQPQKAPSASWPGVLLAAKKAEPDWDGVNKAF